MFVFLKCVFLKLLSKTVEIIDAAVTRYVGISCLNVIGRRRIWCIYFLSKYCKPQIWFWQRPAAEISIYNPFLTWFLGTFTRIRSVITDDTTLASHVPRSSSEQLTNFETNVVWPKYKCLFCGNYALRSAAGQRGRYLTICPAREDTRRERLNVQSTFL